MSWLAACKEYAASVGKWTVPKKDSDEYKAIKAIQARMAGAAAPAPAPAAKKPKLVISTEEAAVVPDAVVKISSAAKAPKPRKEKAPAVDVVHEAAKAEVAKKAAKTAVANAKDAAIAVAKEEAAKVRKAPRKAAAAEVPVDATKAEQPAKAKRATRTNKETTVVFS